ncbi:MAG: N-acetylglucosamine-6-phosphate deacetylase [Spirochaetaceae bacterium 4572_59]|nr:MAG: N-acetylglucosamine-6-phosphate deacetylase [Spirochaetaceae bacterium 4572_59]
MSNIWLINGTVITGYLSQEKCCIYVEDGQIGDVISLKRFQEKKIPADALVYDVKGAWITPGFIDSHIHGFGGFGTEDGKKESILGMSEKLAGYGVTSFCPTVYSNTPEAMLSSIIAIVEAKGEETGATILGIHLEGPFISVKRLGAQNKEGCSPVDMELMDKLFQAGKGLITNMTVAPELKGMRELALYCLKKGITLQAGHTDAAYENMVEGMQAGILHSTHFFNAMSRLHHRNPGAVGAIMIHPEMSCEIIADGEHVHPELLRLLMRDKPVSKVVLVTDALKPTEQEHGPFKANHEEVELVDNVFKKKNGVLAGSCLTMIRGIENLVSWGVPIEQAVQMAGSNPARILGNPKLGNLVPGSDADITVFDKQFNVLVTIAKGRILKNLIS